MRVAILVLLAAAAYGQPMSFLQRLEGRFEQSAPRGNAAASPGFRQERLQDVNAFNSWFDRTYLPAYQAQPGLTPQRQAFVGRALAYLGAIRGLAGTDPALGMALSGAFNRIGGMQETADRQGAVYTYNNAALLLNQLANQNPNDPNVRGQLAFVGGRVNALGGRMPVWISMPVGGYNQPQEPRGIPEPYLQVPVKTERPAATSYPQLDESTLDAGQKAQWRELFARYTNVLVTVYAAKNALAPVEASVQSRGFAMTPDMVRATTRMDMTLDLARRDIEERRFDEARENLQIAEGEARRVLKYVGL